MYPNRMFWFVANQVAGRTRLGATQASASDARGLADDPPKWSDNSRSQLKDAVFVSRVSSNPSQFKSIRSRFCLQASQINHKIRPPKRSIHKKCWFHPSLQWYTGQPWLFHQGYKAITKWACPKVGYPKKPKIDHLPHQKWPFWGVYPYTPQCWANWEAHPSMPHMSSVKTYWKIEFHVLANGDSHNRLIIHGNPQYFGEK